MNLPAYKAIYKHFGITAVLHTLVISAIDKLVTFRLFIVYRHTRIRDLGEPSPGVDIHELSRDELESYIDVPDYELPRSFVEQALAEGNRCIGAFLNNRLGAYVWYADAPTTHADGVRTYFDTDYIYSYKGLTLKEYRGNQLSPQIRNHALARALAQGKRGIIGAVASHNFRARRTWRRLGVQTVGYCAYVFIGRRFFSFNVKGCRSVGYRLVQAKNFSGGRR